jgi:hypothetical protein
MYRVQQPVAGAQQPQIVAFDNIALLLLLLLLSAGLV